MRFDDEDVRRLEKKLRRSLGVLGLLFPRGVGFAVGERVLTYQTWRGRIRDGVLAGEFVLRIPPFPFKEALAFDHVGDLGIPMFADIELKSRIDPRMVYLFFMLVTLDDYGHTTSPRNLARCLRSSGRNALRRIPAPPRSPARAQPTSTLAAGA